MLGWLIVLGISMVVGVGILFLPEVKEALEKFLTLLFVVCCITALVSIFVVILSPLSASYNVSMFVQQKEYIENHKVVDPVENATITTKKIELNAWLFNAKWSKDKWGIFSFYPDTIEIMEPIQ
jgi:cation transport ATPase